MPGTPGGPQSPTGSGPGQPSGSDQETGGDGDDGEGTGFPDDTADAGSESGSGSGSGAGGDDEPSFDEPTFEESATASTSRSRPVLDQRTLEELEEMLERELGTFDGTVMQEQRGLEDRAGGAESDGSGSRPSVVFSPFPGGQAGSEGGTGQSSIPDVRATTTGAASDDSNVPPPHPDDDIVARQLREAAIAESDPTVKERLWAEYYRYTGRSAP